MSFVIRALLLVVLIVVTASALVTIRVLGLTKAHHERADNHDSFCEVLLEQRRFQGEAAAARRDVRDLSHRVIEEMVRSTQHQLSTN